MTQKLWIDFETYSETPIKYGTYRYASECEPIIVAYAIDDGPVRVIDLTVDIVPMELRNALVLTRVAIYAHNAMFDRLVLRRMGYETAIERWRCTMVHALAHSLPGSLETLCDVLGVPVDKAKHKTGKALMRLFCTPRPKGQVLRRATRDTHPEQWAEFMAYAGNDISAMREVFARLPQWNYGEETTVGRYELAMWHLDQRINDRGFAVDLDLAEAAVAAVEQEQTRLRAQTVRNTGGEVEAATQRDVMLEHILLEYGVELPDLKSSTLERRLQDPELPEGLRELLRIRQQASTTSTSKYQALLRGATGGRLRGTLQYNGAQRTGRWAGRTFQPQNLPSRGLLKARLIEEGIEALLGGYAELMFDDIMLLTASTIRGCIIAPPGKRLCVADLSNIEGRKLAWLAGEEWKLQAFREYDKGTGPDLYNLAYAKSFGIPVEEVTKEERSAGKVQELALGYAGGVGAFVTFAAAYSIDLEALAVKAWDNLPLELVEEATSFRKWAEKKKMPTFGLSDRAYITCDVFKRAWRAAHPNVVALWAGLNDICVHATQNQATTFEYGYFKARRSGGWLRLQMPSGRSLCYPAPQVDDKGSLSYMGVNQYTRKWSRIHTHGGKLAENVTQASSKDVLAYNMPNIDEVGYEIVLSVHDELLTEAEDFEYFSGEELALLMSNVPAWAPGLPLAAAGFTTYRYRKD